MFKYKIKKVVTILIILFVIILLADFIKKYCFCYETPEEAYQSIYGGQIYEVVEGNETDYVIGSKSNVVFEKTDRGWKLPLRYTATAKSIKSIGKMTIYVTQYNHSDEYYLIITGYEGNENSITDNRNSTFYKVDVAETMFGKGVRGYFTYVRAIDDNYTLTINGHQVFLLR